MPQILLDPNHTLGGVPNNSTVAKKFLGEASLLRNGLLYSMMDRPIVINQSYWVNDIFSPARMSQKVELFLNTLKRILSGVEIKGVSQYLPFPVNDRSILQSLVPIRPPKRKAHWVGPDRRYEGFLFSNFNKTYYDDSLEFMMYEPNGGWEFTRPHLMRFITPNDGILQLEDLIEIVQKHSEHWIIPYFDKVPSGSEIDDLYVNPDSYSGFWTSNFFGHTKRQATSISNVIAKNLYNLIKCRLTVDTSLKTCGGRAKAVKYSELGEQTVSRVVMQEETCISQIKQLFARRITNAYKSINEDRINPHSIGLNLIGSHWIKFSNLITDLSCKILVGDVISSDSSVREDVLILAFSILRCSFPDKREIDRAFFFFCSGHIYKRVVLPGGFVYCIIGGIQSGCPFTSHLNTIATRILLLSIVEHMKLTIHGLLAYGDDWMIFSHTKEICSYEFMRVSELLLGVKLKDIAFGFADNGSYQSNSITFLKTGLYNGLPGRVFNDVVKKLRYSHEYSRIGLRQLHEVLISMFIYSWGNNRTAEHMIEYITYVCTLYNVNPNWYINKMLRINFSVFYDFKNVNPKYAYNDIIKKSSTRYYPELCAIDVIKDDLIFQAYIRKIFLGYKRRQ